MRFDGDYLHSANPGRPKCRYFRYPAWRLLRTPVHMCEKETLSHAPAHTHTLATLSCTVKSTLLLSLSEVGEARVGVVAIAQVDLVGRRTVHFSLTHEHTRSWGWLHSFVTVTVTGLSSFTFGATFVSDNTHTHSAITAYVVGIRLPAWRFGVAQRHKFRAHLLKSLGLTSAGDHQSLANPTHTRARLEGHPKLTRM